MEQGNLIILNNSRYYCERWCWLGSWNSRFSWNFKYFGDRAFACDCLERRSVQSSSPVLTLPSGTFFNLWSLGGRPHSFSYCIKPTKRAAVESNSRRNKEVLGVWLLYFLQLWFDFKCPEERSFAETQRWTRYEVSRALVVVRLSIHVEPQPLQVVESARCSYSLVNSYDSGLCWPRSGELLERWHWNSLDRQKKMADGRHQVQCKRSGWAGKRS